MAFALNIGKCSLLGNYRENNEDSIDVKQFPDLIVSIVADGMGGQAAGEIASKRAIEIIPRELRKNLSAHLNADGVKTVDMWGVVEPDDESANPAWKGFSDFKRTFGGTPLRHPGLYDLVTNRFWYTTRRLAQSIRSGLSDLRR